MTRHPLPPAPPLLSSIPTSGTESPCPHGTEEVPDEKVSSPPDSVVGVSSTSIVHEWRYAGERFGIRSDGEVVRYAGRGEWVRVICAVPLSIALNAAAKEILRLLNVFTNHSEEKAPTVEELIANGCPPDAAPRLASWFTFWFGLTEEVREEICRESESTIGTTAIKTLGQVATERGLWSFPIPPAECPECHTDLSVRAHKMSCSRVSDTEREIRQELGDTAS